MDKFSGKCKDCHVDTPEEFSGRVANCAVLENFNNSGIISEDSIIEYWHPTYNDNNQQISEAVNPEGVAGN